MSSGTSSGSGAAGAVYASSGTGSGAGGTGAAVCRYLASLCPGRVSSVTLYGGASSREGGLSRELEAAGADLSAFVDGANASEWSAPYLKWAADKGLVEGYDEPAGKRLAPGENASRERAATVLMRAFYLGVLK